ncbi:MAG: transcriptional repressor [Clostridia bacterium]
MITRENYSKKRVAILELLCSTKIHPTAEWVYNELKPQYKDLSLGTVYRNIKKFCADGKVKSVGVIDGQEHFDGNTNPHSHFLCENCGCIIDIHETFLNDAQLNNLSQQYGLEVFSKEIVFRGICYNCKTKNTQ